MRRQPPFISIQCCHCGALVALVQPRALVYDTRFRCGLCEAFTLVRKQLDIGTKQEYTEMQPA